MKPEIIARRNSYAVHGNTVKLTITKRDGTQVIVTIDKSDLPQVQQHVWHVQRGRSGTYIQSQGKGTQQIRLARLLTDCDPEHEVTYRDKDTTNCRRSNLLLVSHDEMCRRHRPSPKTGHAYVTLEKCGRYRVWKYDGKRAKPVRYFVRLADAAKASVKLNKRG